MIVLPSYLPTTLIHLHLSSGIKRNEIVSTLGISLQTAIIVSEASPLGREEDCGEAIGGRSHGGHADSGRPKCIQSQSSTALIPHPPRQLHSLRVYLVTVLISPRDVQARVKEGKQQRHGAFKGLPHWSQGICPGVVAASAVPEFRAKTAVLQIFTWCSGAIWDGDIVFDLVLLHDELTP